MKNHLRNNIVHFQEDLETLCLELALEPNKVSNITAASLPYLRISIRLSR